MIFKHIQTKSDIKSLYYPTDIIFNLYLPCRYYRLTFLAEKAKLTPFNFRSLNIEEDPFQNYAISKAAAVLEFLQI